MSFNKLHIEADNHGHFGNSHIVGNPNQLSTFIAEIMEQHPGVRNVIKKAVLKSSLRFDVYKEVGPELENEADEIAKHLAVVINHTPSNN